MYIARGLWIRQSLADSTPLFVRPVTLNQGHCILDTDLFTNGIKCGIVVDLLTQRVLKVWVPELRIMGFFQMRFYEQEMDAHTCRGLAVRAEMKHRTGGRGVISTEFHPKGRRAAIVSLSSIMGRRGQHC